MLSHRHTQPEDHNRMLLQQPERTEETAGAVMEPLAVARSRRRPPMDASAPPPLLPLLFSLLMLALSSCGAAAALGAPVGEDYVRPPARSRKALLSLFPWSKKKASSSAADPQQVTSWLPNFVPIALDLVGSDGVADVFRIQERNVSWLHNKLAARSFHGNHSLISGSFRVKFKQDRVDLLLGELISSVSVAINSSAASVSFYKMF